MFLNLFFFLLELNLHKLENRSARTLMTDILHKKNCRLKKLHNIKEYDKAQLSL